MCGLGLGGMNLFSTPGYAGLDRDVPVYPLADPTAPESLAPAYNVLIYSGAWPTPGKDYGTPACFGDVCVATRPGACSPEPERTVNAVLAQGGF
jgi:hypothetical protein